MGPDWTDTSKLFLCLASSCLALLSARCHLRSSAFGFEDPEPATCGSFCQAAGIRQGSGRALTPVTLHRACLNA